LEKKQIKINQQKKKTVKTGLNWGGFPFWAPPPNFGTLNHPKPGKKNPRNLFFFGGY